jgi:hypothetical protein
VFKLDAVKSVKDLGIKCELRRRTGFDRRAKLTWRFDATDLFFSLDISFDDCVKDTVKQLLDIEKQVE